MSTELSGFDLDSEMREAVCRMKRGVTSVPDGIRDFFYDLCREEPRVKHPMGRYPHTAVAFAQAGAPWEDVVLPMTRLKGILWTHHYLQSLPCLMEATHRETEANNQLNHAQIRVVKNPGDEAWIDSALEAAEAQLAETRYYRAVLQTMKYRRVKS